MFGGVVYKFFAACIFFLLSIQTVFSVTIQSLYETLKQTFPSFNNITYQAPSMNYFAPDWFFQTPNAWSKTLAQYNLSLTPLNGNTLNQTYQAPTCSSDSDCQGSRHCLAPNYDNYLGLCLGDANTIEQRMYNAISQANNFVYYTTLQPTDYSDPSFTSGAFTAVMKNAIIALAKKSVNSSHPIYVRLLQGNALPLATVDAASPSALMQSSMQQAQSEQALKLTIKNQHNYLANIVNDPEFPKNNKLIIRVASQRSCLLSSHCGNNDKQSSLYFSVAYNHAKIIDIDGQKLITGGQNLWGNDYLSTNPVNDSNIEITGPVAKGAATYVNQLWQFVAKNNNKYLFSNVCATYNYQTHQITSSCPNNFPNATSELATNDEGLQVLAMPIAKLNNGVLPKSALGHYADQSEFARVYAFNHATSSIKISQQSILFKFLKVLHPHATLDGTAMEALANALVKHVKVEIVTSNLNANQSGYSSTVDSATLKQYIENLLINEHHLSQSEVTALVNQYLTIKTIAYNNQDPKATTTSSHNKMWIVDDHLFYIGSHNLYPTSLQQFGVIVDSARATQQLEKQWWQPLWQNANNS